MSIGTRNFSGSIINAASALCSANGYSFETFPGERKHDLLEDVARALIEQRRLLTHRLGNRLAPSIPVDTLCHQEARFTEGTPQGRLVVQAASIGPTLKRALKLKEFKRIAMRSKKTAQRRIVVWRHVD